MDWRNAQMDILRQTRPLTMYNQYEWFEQISTDPDQAIFAIIDTLIRDKDYLLGYCGLVHIDHRQRRAEASLLVDPEIAEDINRYTEVFFPAAYQLFQYGFEEMGLNKISSETWMFRECHIKLMELAGMTKEGVLRKHQFARGAFQDAVIHSMLAEEWPDNKRRIGAHCATNNPGWTP